MNLLKSYSISYSLMHQRPFVCLCRSAMLGHCNRVGIKTTSAAAASKPLLCSLPAEPLSHSRASHNANSTGSVTIPGFLISPWAP